MRHVWILVLITSLVLGMGYEVSVGQVPAVPLRLPMRYAVAPIRPGTVQQFIMKNPELIKEPSFNAGDPTAELRRVFQSPGVTDLVHGDPLSAKAQLSKTVFIGADYQSSKKARISFVEANKEGFRSLCARSIKTANLRDKWNSEVFQSKALKLPVEEIGKRSALGETPAETPERLYVVVDRNVDAQMLSRNVGANGTVVRMSSRPEQFERNIARLSTRTFSDRVQVFDFSPRSYEAHRKMGLPGDLDNIMRWTDNREQIRSIAEKSHLQNVMNADRSLSALYASLDREDGAVIVLFAHSDGKAIYLDTDEGVVSLDPEKIAALKSRGRKLPVLALINCEASGALTSEFLDAGAPAVLSSDRPISANDARTFFESFLKKVSGGRDVIDALFEAGCHDGPPRFMMHVLNSRPSPRHDTEDINHSA